MMTLLFMLFGVAVGSFLNVLILRIPKEQNIAFPASHCPRCETPLKWYHNIPLLSWVFLRGKCAFCNHPISFQYPLVELSTAIIFGICSFEPSLKDAILFSLVFTLLLALSIIDLRYKAVPDSLSLSALLLVVFTGDILLSMQDALLYAGGFALLRILISFAIKKEAMGEADIIIAAIIGATLGTPLGLVAIYLSALIALPAFLLVAKKGFELPFIPFLTLGLWVTYLFDETFLVWIGQLYG